MPFSDPQLAHFHDKQDISEPVKKKKKKQKAVEDVHEATETTEAKITKVRTSRIIRTFPETLSYIQRWKRRQNTD